MSDNLTELDFLYDQLDYCLWNGDKEGTKEIEEKIKQFKEE